MGSMRGLCHTSLCQSLNNLKPGITLKQFDAVHHIVRIADVSLVGLVKESVYGRHQNSGSFSSSHGFPCFLK